MIVLNTLTAAVTEYDWDFQSITPTHAGDALGLYLLGGDLDGDQPIVAEVRTGLVEWGDVQDPRNPDPRDSHKKQLEMVYFSVAGEGVGCSLVQDSTETYRYNFDIRSSMQSRSKPGLGIRDNFLAFGYTNPDGDMFRLYRIEVLVVTSSTRRV